MNRKTIIRFLLVGLILVFVFAGTALAAKYPKKPITMIIPFSAGGSHDLNSRVFTSIIPQYLGQAVVVKLMPGAGGQTGTAAAVRAKPDGYTLIFTHNYVDQLQPLIEDLPYDTMKALVTVWRLNYAPPIVFVRVDKPWKTFEELMDYGRKNPGKLQFAHSGKWGATFTPGAMMLSKARVNAQFIPYKGGGPAVAAILAGDADFIRSFKELGFEGGNMDRIIMAPRKLKAERLQILRDAFRKLYKDKTFKKLMGRIGENMLHMDGPDYEKVRAQQKEQYRELVRKITGK
jgi:tripartite-type tricarboxylate transporter receptor subunit TctC